MKREAPAADGERAKLFPIKCDEGKLIETGIDYTA